jgi:dihydrofolate reductase
VAALTADDGGDLHVIGSTNLVQSLLEHDLVDEFRFIVDPLVVGGGKRIFGDNKTLRTMRLVDHQVTSKGALIVKYTVSH